MADTIKKSRIVSDEDMEESLLEEFNLRLKQCMSSEEEDDDEIEEIYENIEVRINGHEGEDVTDEVICERSVRDRMLLSTDDASCLLFTQTVTSPMLTPSEENIDFLQGFRRDSDPPPNPISEPDNQDQTDPIYENVRVNALQQTVEFLNNEIKAIEEPLVSKTIESSVNERLTHTLEAIDAQLDEINSGMYVEEIRNGLESHSPEKHTPDIPNGSIVPQMEKLKTDLLQSMETNVTKLIVQEQSELDELKSLNIMRQAISRFEETTPTNPSNTLSAVTETYTTQTQSAIANGGEHTSQTIKKKTKKKTSRNGDKENISVVHEFNEPIESFYNVNVKSLCRSFGDLTKVGVEEAHAPLQSRTKSLTEVNNLTNLTNSTNIENVFNGVCVRNLKSSFNKFDAMAKKNAINSQTNEQDMDGNCKKCGRAVFHMERIKAEKSIYHRNCFRCVECERQLLVDTFESHEGQLYCKSHFKALFAPKAVDDEEEVSTNKYEVIIRENQPKELPPDVVRASDKPDLGLNELHTLNVKERFQVFENINSDSNQTELTSPVSLKRGPTILSKLAKFQSKGMDVGVTDEALNGIQVEESASEDEPDDDEDVDLIRAKKVQKEKPFHFVQLQDVKSKWEHGGREQVKDERREERKQEIQTIRSRLFLGKQGKMKEAYQQAVMEAELSPTIRKETPVESAEMRSIKEKWEKGELTATDDIKRTEEDMSLFESGISKQSRSIFMEMDANAAKSPPPPTTTANQPIKVSTSVRSAREAYLARQANENTVRATDYQDEVQVRTEDVQNKFNFFETYKEPERNRREFRMTPPREGQLKSATPEREVYKDPNIVRTDDYRDTDKVIAKATHTTSKMLNKFRQMEENVQRNDTPAGLKPLKRFTPPREPLRKEESSEEDGEEESEEETEEYEERMTDNSLMEAQKAARAKQLRAKFERWEEKEIRREQTQTSTYNIIVDQNGEEQSQLETTKSLRSKFESLRENTNGQKAAGPRVKVNRFVATDLCTNCGEKVYQLEKVTVHGQIYHRNCFRCKECHTVLRMDSYSFNQGLVYCTTHFKRLFITKGNYDTAFGLEQHKDKWNAVIA